MDSSNAGAIALFIVLALVVIFVIVVLVKSVRIVPQAQNFIVERLGRYARTLQPGLHLLIPFVDRIRAGVDLREQVVSFAPQPVITSDNLVVSIDTVIYFQVTEPKSAVYEIANYITGIEQLTVTTLRNVIGSMDLEQTLTSRDQINGQLRGVLDEATGRWGIRVNRVELKAIDPPRSVQDSMEKQMRAERDRRATILTAEGIKQSAILTAEGEKQAQILRAEGTAQAAILEAQGESRAITQVFDAIHRGNADPKLLAYQYIQSLPKMAEGTANKVWVIPADLTSAISAVTRAFGGKEDGGQFVGTPWTPSDGPATEFDDVVLPDPAEALRQARNDVESATAEATSKGSASGMPFDRDAEVGQQPGFPAPAAPVLPSPVAPQPVPDPLAPQPPAPQAYPPVDPNGQPPAGYGQPGYPPVDPGYPPAGPQQY